MKTSHYFYHDAPVRCFDTVQPGDWNGIRPAKNPASTITKSSFAGPLKPFRTGPTCSTHWKADQLDKAKSKVALLSGLQQALLYAGCRSCHINNRIKALAVIY